MRYVRLISVVAVVGALLHPLCAAAKDEPATAEDLLKRFEAALQAKNKDAIMALFDWQGVSEGMKAMQQQTIGNLFQQEAKSVKLSPYPAGFTAEAERDGIRYRPNVTIVGVIEIQHAREGSSTQMPYGKTNNVFYLSSTIEERFAWPATKEKSLSVSVHALSPELVSFEGFYVYLKGGKEIKEEIKDIFKKGNVSEAFFGDRIKCCKVQKTSKGGVIWLTITEDGKVVFKSELEKTDKPIEYEAKF